MSWPDGTVGGKTTPSAPMSESPAGSQITDVQGAEPPSKAALGAAESYSTILQTNSLTFILILDQSL